MTRPEPFWCPICFARFSGHKLLNEHHIWMHETFMTKPDGLYKTKRLTYNKTLQRERLAEKRASYYSWRDKCLQDA